MPEHASEATGEEHWGIVSAPSNGGVPKWNGLAKEGACNGACEAGAACVHRGSKLWICCSFCNVIYHKGCPGGPQGARWPLFTEPHAANPYSSNNRRVGRWWCASCDATFKQKGGKAEAWEADELKAAKEAWGAAAKK